MPTILVVTARIIILDDDKILRPKVEVLPPPLPSLSSPPAQLVAPPTPATLNSNHEAEQDIARMRMKARTYTSTEGICGPLAEGSVTLFGTPKNTATDSEEASKLFKGHAFFDRPACAGGTERSYILTALSQAALEVSSIAEEKSDDSKQNPGSPKTLGVVPREAHGPGEEKPEKRRGSNRASKSISMREPRSIFLHQVTNRAGEEDEEDEDMDDPAEAIPCKKESLCTCIQKMCLWLVCLEYFDYIMGLAILANAVLMGVQADIAVQNARTGAKEPPVIRAVAVVLGAVFTAELVIRILAYRLDFFMKPGWRWNAFDFLLVFLQLSEEVVTVLACLACSGFAADPRTQESGESSGSLRPPRVPRAFECRTLVQSIASTMTSLLWTVVLLLLLIFVVGICFTQVVADVGLEAPQLIQEGTDTFEYYGSLLRSVMSLYQSITSGVSWRDASQPLERHQPIMGLIFAVYIAFAALAMLNVITGVFVESAMASARDRASADIALLEENNVTVVSRMRELVSKMEIGESGRMTWEQFEGQLNNPIMEAYFKSLDLSVTEAESSCPRKHPAAGDAACDRCVAMHFRPALSRCHAAFRELPCLDADTGHTMKTVSMRCSTKLWSKASMEYEMADADDLQYRTDSLHSLFIIMRAGFAADRVVLCGFSQGGTLALQAGLSFPHMLAGICAVASWVTADLPAVDGKSELPILMCHGDEDTMVPIAVARRSCRSLASKGYSKVNLVTVKGLRHQLIAAELEEIFEFLRQVLPQGATSAGESPDAFPSTESRGCLAWLHDASLVGRVDETLVRDGAFLLAEVTSLLEEAKMAGFAAEKTVVGGFGAGGTAALLALPSTRLAGLLCTSAYPSSGLPSQAATGEDQLIVVLHGLEDLSVMFCSTWQGLFRLLDIDNEGSIDVEEFIAGCCRIHGPAKAIDLTTLMCQVMLLHRQPALSDSSTVAVDSAAVEDFLHFTGFLAGGETPATMSSASPLAKMQGTPRSARRFSFCLPAEEKALSNDNLTLELPELNEMEASGDLVDSSPRTHGSNRRSANSSDKNLNGNLPAGKPLYLDLLDKTQAFYLVFFKITYIVTSIIVLAVFYKLDATYERQKDTCSLAAILVPCSVSALLLAETYQPFDILWTFSQFCEGFAMVPQYVFCYRDSSRLSKDVGVTLYVLSMGAYRCFYAANWIYKKARCHASPATTLEVSPRASAGVRPGPAKRSPAPSAAICAQLATANGALSDYVKVRTVGRGSFGEALLVRHRSSGQMSVLKRVRLEGSSDAAAAAESAAREAQVLQKLRHPHIVEFLGAFVDNSRDSTGGTLCLLMAFCEGGDLQHRLQKVRQECRRLSEQPALRWFDELCSALAYVHQHQVLHRDLKPSNIFLSGRSAGSEVLPPTETKLSELREIDLYEPEAWWQGRTQDEEQQDAEVAQMLARQGSFGLPAQQRVVTMQCGVCQSSVQVQVPLSAAPDSVIRVPCPRCTAENEIPGSSMRAGPPPGMVGPSMFDPSMMGDALDDELIHVGCEMGNTMVEMMIDTGAQTSVISEPLVRRLQLQGHMDSRFQGMAAGVGTARILGKLRGVPVKMGHVEFALALRIQL
eukprot:s1143_g8.t2